jgi:hypothetical protein
MRLFSFNSPSVHVHAEPHEFVYFFSIFLALSYCTTDCDQLVDVFTAHGVCDRALPLLALAYVVGADVVRSRVRASLSLLQLARVCERLGLPALAHRHYRGAQPLAPSRAEAQLFSELLSQREALNARTAAAAAAAAAAAKAGVDSDDDADNVGVVTSTQTGIDARGRVIGGVDVADAWLRSASLLLRWGVIGGARTLLQVS